MDFDKSNTPLSVNSRRSVCVGGMVADNSKEQGLYDIYQMLKKHFDEKTGRKMINYHATKENFQIALTKLEKVLNHFDNR